MAIPVKSEVQALLGPFHSRIWLVVQRAWNEWRLVAAFRRDNNLGPLLYPRTVANDVFDAIARDAIAEFGQDPSVNIKIEPQSVKLFFKGGVLARFKKGDESKLGRNIVTEAVLAFTEADLCFPGLPPETAKVEFIWIANSIQTLLEHVLVVARDGDRLLWHYDIDDSAEGGGTIVPFPPQPTPRAPDDNDNEGMVKPKKQGTKKREKE
jgi:hypothetical protein